MASRTKLACLALLLGAAFSRASAEVDYGELRLHVTDPAGVPLRAKVEVQCPACDYDRTFTTGSNGELTLSHLVFGLYRVQVNQQAFAPFSLQIGIHSAIPVEEPVRLALTPVVTQVQVKASELLLDPAAVSALAHIGTREISERVASLPGRSVQDLVVGQPGWLYEGNAVLHPRGSEYQTQFVIDGIPFTDNRSPGFGPEIEADDLESIAVATDGYSAEYGRKMGGVVELNTRRPDDPGVHGQAVLAGGAYNTLSGFGDLEVVKHHNSYGASAEGSATDHYLNPVVPENFTNRGTTGDFSLRFASDLSTSDRLTLNLRHELAHFQVPDELLQQQAGQVQTRDTLETVGTAAWQHILSPQSLLTLSGMVRDNANDLQSNTNPTPIAAFLHNSFREGYFKAAWTLHHGRHEIKAGLESDATLLHENFHYTLTDPDFFDDDTAPAFAFAAHRPDLEQSAWLEDTFRFGNWSARAGLRWDHYQLVVNQNAFSPRFALSRYLPHSRTVLHASFDRVFQTPSYENILLSSSSAVGSLGPDFLRLPVKPSEGNYYGGGVNQLLSTHIRLDANVFRRDVRNFADDDQLLNTGVSYPIAFNRSVIYGAEGKLSIPQLGRLTGFLSYSYMVSAVWFPVSGGLFLGDDAQAAALQTTGHFPASQDQRNTAATRFQYQLMPRFWLAAGAAYGSGLPFDFNGDPATALAEYGPAVIARVNFDRQRIRPNLTLNTSAGLDLYRRDESRLSLQIDAENLADRLDVIDFGGLFSGNAIGPGRSVYARLQARF